LPPFEIGTRHSSLQGGRFLNVENGESTSRTRPRRLDKRASLAGIAALAGYESEFSFSRAFKRVFGVAPGVYRRSDKADAATAYREKIPQDTFEATE